MAAGRGRIPAADPCAAGDRCGVAMAPSWLCDKSTSLWHYRLDLRVLVAMGVLGLCYLFYQTVPLQKIPPSPRPAPRLPPVHVPPTVVPCVANVSVHNISGFAKLPRHVQDFMRYRHCRSFPELLGVPGKCGGPEGSHNVFLLLAIKSSPANYERREVIRKTWGKERTFEGAFIRRVFLVGVSPNARDTKKLNRLLRVEQREHQDMLQWDFKDTFFNLTLKQVLFHAWLEENCPGAHFIFNGDDDVFVNTDNMVHFAMASQGAQEKHLMVGQLFINNFPVRIQGSKYFVPRQLMAAELYPPYCGGGGMLMSGFTARVITRQSQSIALFPIDDVYLGMCLEKAGLSPASHAGIRTMGVGAPGRADPFDPCYYRELLLVHRFVPYEMVVMWDAIHEPHLRCGKRISIF